MMSYFKNSGQGIERISQEVRDVSEEASNTTNLKSFYYLEDGSISFSILNTRYSTKKLDSGIYDLTAVQNGQVMEIALRINEDKELFKEELNFYYEDKVKNIYSKFFLPEIKEKVNTLGYNHKLGVLLYGKHGTGKTSMFKKYFNDASEKHNSLVFIIPRPFALSYVWKFVQDIRRVQDNPIIIFMDEFDEYFTKYDTEAELKRILDGTDSIDNCFFMMATNYIEKIPDTIKDRPSRVKYKIEVTGIQDEKLIKQFLKQSFDKVGMDANLEDISKMKGYTLDELKQVVLDKIMSIEPEMKKEKKLGF